MARKNKKEIFEEPGSDLDVNSREQEALKIFQGDYNSAKYYQSIEINRIMKWRQEYHGMPYGNEVEGRSKIVSREIKKFSEWQISSSLDPFISTPDIIKCIPLNPESRQSAVAAEHILNIQFCNQLNRFNFLSKALKVLDVDGTLVVKTGWEYAEEEVEHLIEEQVPVMPIPENFDPSMLEDNQEQPLMDPSMMQQGMDPMQQMQGIPQDQMPMPQMEIRKVPVRELMVTVNRPTAVVCRNEDIFIDPTALGDFNNAQFIIHRFATDLSTLKLDGRYKNLDMVIPTETGSDGEYLRWESFTFMDEPRKKVIVYEYWGNYDINDDGIVEPIVCAWVGNTIIRFEENPMPDKKPPFIIVPFLPHPFKFYGEPNGETLGYIQKTKTAILRGTIDSIAKSNNGQVAIKKGALDDVNKRKMLRGDNFEYNGTPNDIFTGTFTPIPQSSFSLLDYITREGEGLTGIGSYGVQQSVDGTKSNNATAKVLDAGNLRKLHIVRNIAENLIKPLLRKWLSYDAKLLGETTIRMAGGDFQLVRPDDLYGDIDINLAISTSEDNAVRAQELSFLLQTIGPAEDPNIRKMIMADIARLYKMNDLADRIENYQPAPDPYQQAIQELTIQKLQAEIQELQTGSGRMQIDAELKKSKIETEFAKARNLGAKSNNEALRYYNDRQGITRQHELQKQQNELQSRLDVRKQEADAKLLMALMKEQRKVNEKNGAGNLLNNAMPNNMPEQQIPKQLSDNTLDNNPENLPL